MDLEEKLRLIRESYEAFNRRDLEALFRLYDPGCEWNMSNYPGWPEKRLYRGREGLAEFFETWFEPWEDFHLEIERIVDLPASRALVVGCGRGRGRLSGAEVELPPLAQIIEFRDGRCLRVDNYSDVEAGRSAAGLSE